MAKKKKLKKPLKAKLKILARKIVMIRDEGKCVKCGTTELLHCSHVYPKGQYRSMEHTIINLKMLCYHHHLEWWHKNPIEAGKWFEEQYPQRAKDLLEMSQTTRHYTYADYEEMIIKYEGVLDGKGLLV